MTARHLGTLLWCFLGVLIAWQAHAHGLGTFAEPGPGMIAFGLGIVMALVGACRVFVRGAPASEPAHEFPWRVMGLSALLAVYFLALVPLGYLLSTVALLLVLLVVFSRLRVTPAIGIAAGATLASYALFKWALGVQLPGGLLG